MIKILTAAQWFISVALLMFYPSVQSAGLTLSQAYQMALTQGAEFSVAQADNRAQREDVPLAKAALLPTLSLDGNHTSAFYQRKTIDLDSPVNSSTVRLSLQHPLYHRTASAQLELAEEKVGYSDLLLEEKRQQIAFDTAKAYLGAVLAKENLALVKAEKESYLAQWEQVSVLHGQGLASRIDLLEAKARVDRSATKVSHANNEVVASKRQLQKMIGDEKGLASEVHIKKLPTEEQALQHLSEFEEKLENYEYWESEIENNLQIKMAQSGLRMAQKDRKVQRSNYYPVVSLNASVSETRHDDPTVLEGSDARVGLEIKLPLYDGGRTSSSVRKSEMRISQATEELRGSFDETRMRTLVLLDRLKNDRMNVDALRVSVQSSQALLVAVEEAQKMGLKDLVDLLDSRSQLYTSKRDLSEAVHDAVIHRLELALLAGKLTKHELTVIDQWLGNL